MKVSSVDLKRTIVLISGHGTNLQAIIDEINENQLPIDITAVISDNPQAFGLERAKKFGIPTHVIDRHSTFNLGNFHHAMEELVKKLLHLEDLQKQFSDPHNESIAYKRQWRKTKLQKSNRFSRDANLLTKSGRFETDDSESWDSDEEM